MMMNCRRSECLRARAGAGAGIGAWTTAAQRALAADLPRRPRREALQARRGRGPPALGAGDGPPAGGGQGGRRGGAGSVPPAHAPAGQRDRATRPTGGLRETAVQYSVRWSLPTRIPGYEPECLVYRGDDPGQTYEWVRAQAKAIPAAHRQQTYE